MTIKKIIDNIIEVEGGFVEDPSDSGGATKYGITVKVARQYGYTGDMKDLPRTVAYNIYHDLYVVKPNFNKIAEVDMDIAAELIDTGVNMGVGIPARFLQQCLNALNDGGSKYPDLLVDGIIGNTSVHTLQVFLKQRLDGKAVLLKALNCLQGARYIAIAETSPKNERYVFGWLKNRVHL